VPRQLTHRLTEAFSKDDVARLRRLVGHHADAVGLAETRKHDLVLAVDEIATNAIRHGGGAGELTLWVSREKLWFRVADRGPGMHTSPPTKPPSRRQIGGRGLWITRQVTDDMSIESGPDGTVVTAAINLTERDGG
jgi:anti-sigma regulatory factor (Ser/Thr protein kinase)